MAKLLTGKEVVASMNEGVISRVGALRARDVEPTLAIVRMGERPDDLTYERTAVKRAENLGVNVRRFVLDGHASEKELLDVIERVNDDEGIHGCLMFRPLPAHIDEVRACNELSVRKDIDGITRASLSSVFAGEGEGFPPATAQACFSMLEHYGIPAAGKRVVVVGRSLVIGRPAAAMFLNRDATVTVCHSRTENLPEVMCEADIVVCATGRARAYGAECFRPGQTVLDVGINFDESGSMCGDVDFKAVEPVVEAITPVPRGLGSVTTSVTIEHVVRAAEACASRSLL